MRALIAATSLIGLVVAGCGGTILPTVSASVSPTGVPSGTAVPTEAGLTTPSGAGLTALVRYVALGDSYTIGTGVKARDRWPNQLVRTLAPELDLDLIANLAVNGATSQEVIDDQLPQLARLDPDVVSLPVGVNVVVQHVDAATYQANLDAILDALLQRVPPGHIVVVTTPDYTLTPQGSSYGDPTRQSARIAAFNKVLQQEAMTRGLTLVDITSVADLVPNDASLLASDGLHPSGKQYAGWVELIAPRVRNILASGK